MWPGFDSRIQRHHMCVEFVVGSRPCSERFFSGYSGFSGLSSETNISQIPIRSGLLSCTLSFASGSGDCASTPRVIYIKYIITLLHFTSLHFTSLYFTLLYFTLFYFTLLYFTSLGASSQAIIYQHLKQTQGTFLASYCCHF